MLELGRFNIYECAFLAQCFAMEPPGREWDAAGKIHRRFCAVHVQIVRKSHPSLPIFMNALEGTVLASNGAMVDL